MLVCLQIPYFNMKLSLTVIVMAILATEVENEILLSLLPRVCRIVSVWSSLHSGQAVCYSNA